MSNTQFDKVINLAAKDTKKGSRVVAKFFYRILRKNGFSESQIIDIATNILNCLTDSLRGYEKKVEHTKKIRQDPVKKEEKTDTTVKVNSKYDKYDSDQNDIYL